MTVKASSPWLDTVPDQRRYPPLIGWVTADVAIIGGGIVGLMTAWNLAAKGRRVVLLEKNHIGTGDTGLTTAFLTRVPDAGAADLRRAYGGDFLARLFRATADAQTWFKELVRREAIACDLVDCASYNCTYDHPDRSLQDEWSAIREADAAASFVTGPDAARCAVPSVQAAIRFDGEARFHIRKLLFGLLERPIGRRIQIFEEMDVTRVQVGDAVVVRAGAGAVLCRSVVCATGLPIAAFAELRDLVKPVLTFALAARYRGAPPMSDDLFWDTGEPYQYFRLLDRETVILGGCDRPADRAREGPAPHATLRAFLDARLTGPYDTAYEWSGTLFETKDGLPYVTEHPHYPGRVFVATGFGGNGMVMGTMAARILADLVTHTANGHAPLFGVARTGVAIRRPGEQAPAGEPKQFVPVGKAADVAAGRPLVLKVREHDIVLFRIDGAVYALDNACSHAGGPLADGTVEGTTVTCPWHGSEFDITSGAVCRGPASQVQRRYAVRTVGETLEVEV